MWNNMMGFGGTIFSRKPRAPIEAVDSLQTVVQSSSNPQFNPHRLVVRSNITPAVWSSWSVLLIEPLTCIFTTTPFQLRFISEFILSLSSGSIGAYICKSVYIWKWPLIREWPRLGLLRLLSLVILYEGDQ